MGTLLHCILLRFDPRFFHIDLGHGRSNTNSSGTRKVNTKYLRWAPLLRPSDKKPCHPILPERLHRSKSSTVYCTSVLTYDYEETSQCGASVRQGTSYYKREREILVDSRDPGRFNKFFGALRRWTQGGRKRDLLQPELGIDTGKGRLAWQ